MRRTAVLLAAAALGLAALGVWFWRVRVDEPTLPEPTKLTAAEQRALAAKMAARVDARARADPNVRTPVEPDPATAVPTVRVRIVDAGSGRAIGGARAFDVQGDTVCATAGDDGGLDVPNLAPGRIVFLAGGYLAKLPTTGDEDAVALADAAEKSGVATIELLRDDYTLPCTLRFVDAAGAPVPDEVRFTVACLDQPPPSGMAFPSGKLAPGARVDRGLVAAWERHIAVLSMVGEPEPLHLGVQSHGHVFTASGGASELRFVGAGNYEVDAVALGAAAAGQRTFHVALGEAGPVEVRLLAGRFAHGVVVDARDRQPIAGAQVRLVQPVASPSGTVETGANGAFRLGPVSAARAIVNVQSRRHLDLDVTLAVGEASKVALTPRPLRQIRGVVRQRGTLQPLAGADVSIESGQTTDYEGKTSATGAFQLETTAEAPQLIVRAPGFLSWLERIDAPLDSYVCDLLPADPGARVRAGLTAIIEGRVFGADGKPVAGIPVQLFTDEIAIPEGIAGRGILEGHILALRPVAVTAADGTFSLEWHQAGTVRLLPADGDATSADGTPVTLVLGQHVRDIVLRLRR